MEPILSLAFSISNNKGATALLLGSGISSSAGILTGWGITMDLVRKLALVEGDGLMSDLETWYFQKYNKTPDYADILQHIASTPIERQALLRQYFVPTEDEREQQLKQPTKAHRAIAKLIAKGYIRVILTTNFDSLLEKALEDVGVHPSVISDVSAIHGMMPLQHAPVTIVKLHGHYLDPRLRNTPEELATYEPELNALIDRVLDEYGLLVCGWSGVWDAALRQAFLRCPNRRFTTYWASVGEIAEEAKQLVQHRNAQVIRIQSADALFVDLTEKVISLDDLAKAHPATTQVAVATIKRYLSNEDHIIRLHDLVTSEVELIWSDVGYLLPAANPTEELAISTLASLDNQLDKLIHLLAVGSYWGKQSSSSLWLNAVSRLSRLRIDSNGGYVAWLDISEYPLVLAFYSVGLGAISANNNALLYDLLLTLKFRNKYEVKPEPPARRLYEPMHRTTAQLLWPDKRQSLAVNDHLHKVLKVAFKEIIPSSEVFDEMFDRFEYLMSLSFYDVMQHEGGKYKGYFKLGRFMVRMGWHQENPVVDEIKKEILDAGDTWPMLQRGLYNSSKGELSIAVEKLDQTIKEVQRSSY